MVVKASGSSASTNSGPNSDTESTSLSFAQRIVTGCKVWMLKDDEYRKAEVLSIKNTRAEPHYYVHYQDFNKRLDEWAPLSRVDTTREIEYPKAEKRKAPSSTASKASTPQPKVSKATKVSKTNGAPNGKATVHGKGANSAIHGKEDPNEEDDEDVAVVQTEALGPAAAGDDEDDDEDEEQLDGTEKHKDPVSKEQEIEKLRTSGSMTQNPHEVARIRNISKVQMGKFEVEPWYFSPYPVEMTEKEVIYVCEFCLLYFGSPKQYERHRSKCKLVHPPGNEIYRDQEVSFFEIDGRKQRVWCRNLSLLSKLFLDHKTLYYDVDPFMFYCMCSRDEYGYHLVGYFSKEKESSENYNVACILTLPQYQRHGYGKLLIEFSYELSKKEGKLGSPEKPLSDLGLLSYRAFWAEQIINLLATQSVEITIDELANKTGMTTQDVLHTLQNLNMLKYYKGQHVIVISDAIDRQFEKMKRKKRKAIDPAGLDGWQPPVFHPSALRFGW